MASSTTRFKPHWHFKLLIILKLLKILEIKANTHTAHKLHYLELGPQL